MDKKFPEISDEAHEAICRGVENQDNIIDMELLGLSQRNINLLEREGGITKLEELVASEPHELLELKNFGDKALEQVFSCLARYHELDDFREIRPIE